VYALSPSRPRCHTKEPDSILFILARRTPPLSLAGRLPLHQLADLDVSAESQSQRPPAFCRIQVGFVARTAASVGSPLIKGHELGLQSVRRGWADVVGLDDSLRIHHCCILVLSPLHNVPPSVKSGRDRTSTVTHTGKVSLPKLQTDGVLEPDLKMQMMRQTPSPVRDSAAFAASLSSSLGLDIETDDTPTEMDLDTSFETASIATADSGFGLAEEPRGEDSAGITNTDGQPVKLATLGSEKSPFYVFHSRLLSCSCNTLPRANNLWHVVQSTCSEQNS
jgi:hypothetical protein